MKILLTNDDGFASPGLQAMREVLYSFESEHDIWIIAPDGERSGMSQYITVRAPIRTQRIREKEFQISGSPADCVRIALAGMMAVHPDIIISGINMGPNLGTDITYSGTVAAARQGAYMSIPSMAVSIFDNGGPFNFAVLARVVVRNLQKFIELWDKDHFININGPNHKSGSARIVITHPCQRPYDEISHHLDFSDGNQYWFIDGKVRYRGKDPGSDWDAVREGHISISPIHIHPVNNHIDQRYEKAGFLE